MFAKRLLTVWMRLSNKPTVLWAYISTANSSYLFCSQNGVSLCPI